jgi:hypothetical protein
VIPAGAPAAAGTDPDSSTPWLLLVHCLTVECAEHAAPLEEAVRRHRDTGGTLFEALVGAPLRRHGPRLTLNAAPDRERQARRLGLDRHPWGPAHWYGLRLGPDGAVRTKPYHRLRVLPAHVRLPAGLPADLVPELASWDGDRTEVYLRRSVAARWEPFARAAFGLVGAEPPACAVEPRPVLGAHCVSLAWTGGVLDAVTVYAADRCLPDDRALAAAWAPGLAPEDRRTYEAALGAVRSLGRVGRLPAHALLGWAARADGTTSRAVSLRVHDAPPSAQDPPG